MNVQTVIKPHTLQRNEAHRIVKRAVQKCTCAGASLRNIKRLPLCCINLDTATEPTCGSGANLIAIANLMREKKFNYQQNAYFVAQDIDPLVAKMCYIQLSLLGCPGVVIIGNTLEGRAGEREYWYTPFHFVFGIGILARKRRQEEAKKEIVIDKAEVAESDTDGLLRAVGII